MQRVAMEMDAAMRRHPDVMSGAVSYDAILLVASWKWVHVLAGPFLIRTWFKLRRKIKQGEVDVILFSSMVTAILTIFLRRYLKDSGVRVATIVHGLDVTTPGDAYQKHIVPRVFDAVDLVMPVSGATGQACTDRGLAPEKLAVVHNGVQLDRFRAPERRAGARDGLPNRRDLPDGAMLLCSIGRQVKRKGFAWFIENVLPSLPNHVHYWLGGDGPEGPSIQAAIEQAGMQDRVRLLGRLGDDQLEALYQGADLFVMPNIPVPGDMEGFGIVMLEAGLSGLPTVAARLEGIKEVIVDNQNGFFVETGDAQGFVDRISSLDSARDDLGALSVRTRQHVIDRHGWDAVAAKYLSNLR